MHTNDLTHQNGKSRAKVGNNHVATSSLPTDEEREQRRAEAEEKEKQKRRYAPQRIVVCTECNREVKRFDRADQGNEQTPVDVLGICQDCQNNINKKGESHVQKRLPPDAKKPRR